jgi:hypothetical protein
LQDFLEYLKIIDNMTKDKAEMVKEKQDIADQYQRGKENLPPKRLRKRKEPHSTKVYVGYCDELTTSVYVRLVVTVRSALELTTY